MDHKNIDVLLDWAGQEGWNPGLEDNQAFLAADPEGFFLNHDALRPAAGISIVNHSADFAFLGLYIAHPDFRGKGLGLSVWARAMDHAGDRTIGLDGVPDQQANYRKSGFELFGKTVRWQGVLDGQAGPLRYAQQGDLAALITLDQRETGVERPRFLTSWFAETAERKTLLVEEAGEITAYATVRTCLQGVKIGPLVAPDRERAEVLIRAAAAEFATAREGIMIDVTEANDGLSRLARDLGMQPGFETARMYRGTPPRAQMSAFSAVATLELG